MSPTPEVPAVGSLQPPAADVTPPELTFSETWEDDKDGRWQSGPTITVEKPEAAEDQEPLPDNIPYVHAFTINTGDVVDTVKLAIGDLKTAVTAYNTHKGYVSSHEGWVFSVASKEDIGADGDPFTNVTTETYNVTPGTDEWALHDVDSYAGPSRELVEQLNTYQHKIMMSASDVITLVSQFTLAVDGAAQAYAQIDYSSQFPDAPTITEVTMSNDGTITQ
ncbi:hypothetical protein ACIA8K_03740 [Catenuloplanes sp. NPDC051500]|uniref:hypothetical protein n=1 Tax=Catenuloplanes sp. NPDC051500 TaxID=3363959 RepID=UPI0037A75EB5